METETERVGQKYNWKELTESGIKSDIDNWIRKPLLNLNSLSTHTCLKVETSVLLKTTYRIAVRLRSAKITRLLNQLNKRIQDYLELDISRCLVTNCSSLLREMFDNESGCIFLPKAEAVLTVLSNLKESTDLLDKVIKYSLYAFGECMPWLRLGHLAPHMVTCSAALSRISAIAKALIVYSCDSYKGLAHLLLKLKDYKETDANSSIPPAIDHFLVQLNLTVGDEPRNERESRASPGVQTSLFDEDIGVPVSRSGRKGKAKGKTASTSLNAQKSKKKKKKQQVDNKGKDSEECKGLKGSNQRIPDSKGKKRKEMKKKQLLKEPTETQKTFKAKKKKNVKLINLSQKHKGDKGIKRGKGKKGMKKGK